MQTYLPLIKAMLSEGYLFILNNALHAAMLAIAVWLLTAIFYSIKIAAQKRSRIAGDKIGIETLSATQQQLQHSQEELAATAEELEKAQRTAQDETQRTFALKQLIHKRNKQIEGIIQMLATSFDLGERPLVANEDVKADSLWQQHDKVITQLIGHLRTEQQAKIELQQACQAETAKLAEREMLLKALQATLDNHTHQLSKLEHALAEQKSILQHQDNAQQLISDTLKKYQPGITQAAEPEQEIIKTVDTWQQPVQLEEPLSIEEPLIAQPEQDNPVIQANEEPQAVPSWQDEEPSIEFEPVTPMSLDITPEATDEEIPSVSSDMEQQPAQGSFGKIKNLFGKTKQQPIKTEPQWDETQPLLSDTEQQTDDISEKAENTQGKLKGFYSKLTSRNK